MKNAQALPIVAFSFSQGVKFDLQRHIEAGLRVVIVVVAGDRLEAGPLEAHPVLLGLPRVAELVKS